MVGWYVHGVPHQEAQRAAQSASAELEDKLDPKVFECLSIYEPDRKAQTPHHSLQACPPRPLSIPGRILPLHHARLLNGVKSGHKGYASIISHQSQNSSGRSVKFLAGATENYGRGSLLNMMV